MTVPIPDLNLNLDLTQRSEAHGGTALSTTGAFIFARDKASISGVTTPAEALIGDVSRAVERNYTPIILIGLVAVAYYFRRGF